MRSSGLNPRGSSESVKGNPQETYVECQSGLAVPQWLVDRVVAGSRSIILTRAVQGRVRGTLDSPNGDPPRSDGKPAPVPPPFATMNGILHGPCPLPTLTHRGARSPVNLVVSLLSLACIPFMLVVRAERPQGASLRKLAIGRASSLLMGCFKRILSLYCDIDGNWM
jgi:hypothetical protein